MSRRFVHRKDYHINIFYSEDDGGYIADIPDLTHCSAFGKTADEALAELLVAKDAWLDAARKNKKPIPSPRYRPVLYQLKRVAVKRSVIH
ncbi:MAG: type II toxin-antitoxin system HicB family antitoxin [Bacteroidetes bacterium]|nr:type II toxin-antitoxin system HicB family antitoxin [Bacteroidota bacterium]MCL5738448.1 type II toxin-antitoxin system HicB family antitoxin [Bacteroidota bacterium]